MGLWDDVKARFHGAAGVAHQGPRHPQPAKAGQREPGTGGPAGGDAAKRAGTARRMHDEAVDIATYLGFMAETGRAADVLIRKDLGPAMAAGRTALIEWASTAAGEINAARTTIEGKGSRSLYGLQIGKAYCKALADYEAFAEALLTTGGRLTSGTDAMLKQAWDDWEHAIRLVGRLNPER